MWSQAASGARSALTRPTIDAFERAYVTSLLARSDDNVAQAARDAGVNRAYLHRLLRRHGLR
jgi:transcriptional regulator with GAF, ATPase, and Fis domain